MKCPYNSNQVTINHDKPLEYEEHLCEDASGCPEVMHMWHHDSINTTTFYQHDCIMGECGAYQDGRCIRR